MTRRFTQKDGFLRLIDYLPTPVEELTVLNLGAGRSDSHISSLLKYLPFLFITHLDVYEPDLEILAGEPHVAKLVTFVVHDLRNPLYFARNSFSVVLGIDVVEHLKKRRAITMIEEAERVASDRVIFFVPLGSCPSFAADQPNPFQEHLSVWTAHDLENLGYNVDIMEDFHDFTTSKFDACWAWKEV